MGVIIRFCHVLFLNLLTSHQPQLMLELLDDSGDIFGLLRAPLPMGPMLKSPCVSRPPRKLLIKKSARGGELEKKVEE